MQRYRLGIVLLVVMLAFVARIDGFGNQIVNAKEDQIPASRDVLESQNDPNITGKPTEDGAGNRHWWVLSVQCLLIVVVSVLGGTLPDVLRLTHARMQVLISLIAGLMLGIGLFHMLPHAIAELGDVYRAVWWMMAGLLLMFFLLRAFHFHQHASAEVTDESDDSVTPIQDSNHHHDHDSQGHSHSHHHPARDLSWAGIFFGLSIHTMIDGTAMAASVQADALQNSSVLLLGLGTFLAVLLHKPLDAVSITSLMAASGWTSGSRQAVNLGFALMCPLGAAFFVIGIREFSGEQHAIVGCALAFSAGVFLCISMSDLLPEVEFHSHDRLKLSAALLLGVAVAYGISLLEPQHKHSHMGSSQPAVSLERAGPSE